MSWLDLLLITGYILTNVWTWRRLSRYSPGSATDAQEVETLQNLVVRLAAEQRQAMKKYEDLERDYQTAGMENRELTEKLERRTKALEACRSLLATKQGVEDSTP